MGTTIRRQPVKFDIPKSPDYKFLNITNFRGLDISSNPFEQATNTASDCLNVYVDETNTLTTRPRLELFANAPIDGDHIGTYNLHDGYLLHYNKYNRDKNTHEIVSKTPTMWFFKNGKLADKQVSGTIPTEKCNYFEQGDKIYLLDGERYMVISENDLSDVDGYVPTTAVVDSQGNKKEVAQMNILTDKYFEKWFWELDSPMTVSSEKGFTNNYFKKDLVQQGVYGDGTSFKVKKESADGVYTHIYIYYVENDTETMVYDIATKFPKINTSGAYFYEETRHKNKVFWYREVNTGYTGCVYNNGTSWACVYLGAINSGNYNMYVSDDGSSYINITDTGAVEIYEINTTSTSYVKTTLQSPGSAITYAKMTDNVLLVWTYKLFVSVDKSPFVEISGFTYGIKGYSVGIGKDDTVWAFTTNGFFINKLSDGTVKKIQQPNIKIDYMWGVDGCPNTTWFVEKSTGKIYIIPDIYNINNRVYSGITLSQVPYYEILQLDSYITKDYAYLPYRWYDNGSYKTITESFHKNITTEPVVVIEKTISSTSPEYEDLQNRKTNILATGLFTRFDNNYWFASKGRYYRSFANNPTYFPITEYNELGDSNEEITGFNLANDTTLVAYKKNKIYLIQPFTSSLDTTEYTITESKNTVGNTAIGAPIITTLTEIPLQINNDGIYGLSQMTNVSATERIADLMSEPINERWLNIPDNHIANIKTLNRLYWTYIIIPREDKHNTWIYILDNRTNSWYYWELPIVTVNAFAKDNRAEFVDTNGNIYYLTTEDIINKAFETLVTEYYDVGNKLIPWYWESQILPLGTMNYSKRLVNTTFVLTDTDNIDGYGLNYSFKVFRKLASSVADTEMSGDLNLVRSTTKKTNISRFGFIQLKLSNINRDTEDNTDQTIKAYRNNKLRLVGLGLKYVLLEGLIK